MTRRHFVLIAGVIRRFSRHASLTMEQASALAHAFADALENTNDHFDSARFIEACGVQT